MAVEVAKPSIVLGLSNTTSQRAIASAIINLYDANLQNMSVDPAETSALCTSNPTVILAVRGRWEEAYPQVTLGGQEVKRGIFCREISPSLLILKSPVR